MPRTRAGLLAFVERDPALRALLAAVRDRTAYDPAHDHEHALRVALWVLRLGGDEVDAREAVAAALLHDVVTLPKNHPERASAGERSAAAAAPALRAQGFDEAAVERVASAIRDHGFSRGAVPGGPLGRALQDADRLEALGAIGLLRCIGSGATLGAAWFDPDDPWAERRQRDDGRYAVDHFFTKLLALPATMLTGEGRREAERRVKLLRDFLERLAEELGAPAPPL
jgi:uncharacterized protein